MTSKMNCVGTCWKVNSWWAQQNCSRAATWLPVVGTSPAPPPGQSTQEYFLTFFPPHSMSLHGNQQFAAGNILEKNLCWTNCFLAMTSECFGRMKLGVVGMHPSQVCVRACVCMSYSQRRAWPGCWAWSVRASPDDERKRVAKAKVCTLAVPWFPHATHVWS